jgi:hypothetical protein
MVDVDKHLLKHFKNSELYLFYQFLKVKYVLNETP